MYKCKECGAEYEVKPYYCDCGNDEFEVFGVVEKKEEHVKEIKPAEIHQEKFEERPPVLSAAAMNFNNSTKQDSYIPKGTFNVEPISLFIFFVCIILSLYVIFFAFNPSEEETKVEIKQEAVTPKNIPSVNKIWNNALPAVKKEEPKVEDKAEEKVENIIKQIIPVQPQKKTEIIPKATSVKPKVTTVTLKKTTQTTKQKTTTATNVKTQTNNTQTQTQAQKTTEDEAKKKADAERKAAEAEQLKKLQAEQAKKAAEAKAKQAAADKQELASYKAQLRNTIGRKVDFTRVIGDGSCTVSFKIDPNGKLVSRSFSKQSSNNTLNDAVYAAVMATPTYNPPPKTYNNEFLNLNIKFYNGNFEISLP